MKKIVLILVLLFIPFVLVNAAKSTLYAYNDFSKFDTISFTNNPYKGILMVHLVMNFNQVRLI